MFKGQAYKILLGILALIVVGVLVINIFIINSRTTDQEIIDVMGPDYSVEYLAHLDRRIRIVKETGLSSDSTLLVFVHGAPHSWRAFKSYMADKDFKEKVQIIAYDRPGYGGSGHKSMVSIKEQADVLNAIINKYKRQKVILVGHSYGAAIVGLLASTAKEEKLKEQVDAVMMIAPLIDPEAEPVKWYAYFSKWPWSRALLPYELGIAGEEKFAHVKALKEIEAYWKRVSVPITLLHGTDDGLAPCRANVTFAERHINPSFLKVITLKDKGHHIVWDDYENVKSHILNLIQK